MGYWNPTIINRVNNIQKLYHHETYLQFTTDKKDGIPWGSYKQVKVSHIQYWGLDVARISNLTQ